MIVLLSGCASTTAEILLGTHLGERAAFEGSGPTATVRIKHRLTDRTWCEVEHVSHILTGPPFNGEAEDWLTQAGCGIRFGGTD